VCPTNDDPTFDNKPRVKRTTGIPRSFLKAVEKPVALSGDGTTDDTKAPSGIMVNADGEFVIAEPDRAAWEQFQAKTKSAAAAQKIANLGDKELQERGLECSIDKRMFIDPMKTPCCEKTYCNDCITNALIESDFTCPGCGTEEVFIDNLKPDEEMTARLKAYLEEKRSGPQEKELPKSPERPVEQNKAPILASQPTDATTSLTSDNATTPAFSSTKSPSPENKIKSGAEVPHKQSSVLKKRPADEALENPKIPKGPKAMQQQEAQRQLQQQQTMMNGMGAFPNMANMGYDVTQPFNANAFSMGMPGMNGMNSFGMGFPGGMGVPPMLGLGMNPMVGMNNLPMGMGFPGMNGMTMGAAGMYGAGSGYGGNMSGMGMAMNMGGTDGGYANGNIPGSFPNQQKNVFAAPLANEEDNAYFRKPVNPHRHQGRQRRARPSDYREL
jgi:protein MPE1